MRFIIRTTLFTYVSLYLTQSVIGGFSFGGQAMMTLLFVVIAMTLLNMFMVPVFQLISLPGKGIGFLFLSFMLTLITFYVLTLFVLNFEIIETTIVELRIFGIVLPSGHLTAYWSATFSSLLFSVLYDFLVWLCKGKK